FNEYDYETDIQVKTEEAERRGHAAGLSEGVRQKAVETARKLMQKNVSVQIIEECTGLSEEEIEKLK
ncbi:MAG: hypothetical protein E7061_11840, partial [Treponema sp.]|nr:hypothetical protein [Treponema sp.]